MFAALICQSAVALAGFPGQYVGYRTCRGWPTEACMNPTLRRNRFLASLSADDLELIGPYLRTVALRHEQVLARTGDTFKQIYFPHDSVISLVVPLSRGEGVEVAMVGRDSVLGVFAALGERCRCTTLWS